MAERHKAGNMIFKSWFRRKSPDQPKPQPSESTAPKPSDPSPLLSSTGQPVPRLVLSGDPSVADRPQGPLVAPTYRGPAFILTEEVETVSSAALEQAIRRRLPDIDFGSGPTVEPTKPGQRPTALGNYPEAMKALQSGRMPMLCGVTYIPNINLEGMDKESYVTTSWWWPQTREVVAKAKAHALTVVMGQLEKTPVKERILIELQLAAAALDVLKTPIAVIWPDANAMWKPADFMLQLDHAKGDIPVTLVAAVKMGRDTENLRPDGTPTLFARTEGLHAFGMMEVEWRGFDGDIVTFASRISGVAWYLINKGAIIYDGDSMGPDVPGFMPPIVIRHEPSTTVLGTRAYVVYEQRLS